MPLPYQRALECSTNVQHSHQHSRVRVSGCELIPERRGRREGGARVGARVGAGISTTAMLQCMYMYVHVCMYMPVCTCTV